MLHVDCTLEQYIPISLCEECLSVLICLFGCAVIQMTSAQKQLHWPSKPFETEVIQRQSRTVEWSTLALSRRSRSGSVCRTRLLHHGLRGACSIRFGALSQAGLLPSINISLTQASDRCADPITVQGDIVGHLRLASFQEWQDAGDGILGAGGTLYPWGDEPHSDQCIMGSGYESFQASGAATDCYSVFGVFDQIGNIWEWVATDAEASVSAWTSAQSEQGLATQVVMRAFMSQETMPFST